MSYQIVRGHDVSSTIGSSPSGLDGLLIAIEMNALTSIASKDTLERIEALEFFKGDLHKAIQKHFDRENHLPQMLLCNANPLGDYNTRRVFVRCDCDNCILLAKVGHDNYCPNCKELIKISPDLTVGP